MVKEALDKTIIPSLETDFNLTFSVEFDHNGMQFPPPDFSFYNDIAVHGFKQLSALRWIPDDGDESSFQKQVGPKVTLKYPDKPFNWVTKGKLWHGKTGKWGNLPFM